MVEHVAHNDAAAGSTPAKPTSKKKSKCKHKFFGMYELLSVKQQGEIAI